MSWQPLVTGERRAAVERLVRELVAAVDADGAPSDRALLRAYVAQDDVVPDPDDTGGAALAEAVAAFADTASGPGLFGGVAGIGWLVAHIAAGESADQFCASVDEALMGAVTDWPGPYDLIGGLVGFGVYALERAEAGRPLAIRVLDELARQARPRGGGLAWHTAPGLLPPHQLELAPEGYWNLGLAHGIPGVVAVLARFVAAGTEVDRARRLLDAAVTALLAAERPAAGGRYPAWHPGGPDTSAPGIPDRDENRARLAWCYNDLGVAVALLSAAQVTRDESWRAEALALARACAGRSIEEGQVLDTALCHGATGAAHLFNRLRHATGDDLFADAARRWLDRALAMRTDQPLAGFPSRSFSDGAVRWTPDASLLNGITGVALVLHAMITPAEPAWDRMLLADLETD